MENNKDKNFSSNDGKEILNVILFGIISFIILALINYFVS